MVRQIGNQGKQEWTNEVWNGHEVGRGVILGLEFSFFTTTYAMRKSLEILN